MPAEDPNPANSLVQVADKTADPQPLANISSEVADLSLSNSAEDNSAAQATVLAKATLQRCRHLVEELQQFQVYLEQHKKEHKLELRSFRNNVKSEMKLLDKLSQADPNSSKTSHGLRSSNFSFYATVWAIAKTCSGLRAISKKFYWTEGQNKPSTSESKPRRIRDVLVDIVAQDGLQWIKISSATEKRIIWDLAKAGWVGSSDDESDDGGSSDLSDDEPEGLVRQAETLMKAAQATRVHYRHPTVSLILPRIKAQPESAEVAKVLQKIRKLGITVQTMEDVNAPESTPVADVMERLAPDQLDAFSDSLNVDCTLLLAFASDLSHGRVEPEDWHNKFISKQIVMENEEQLLPNSLWPICGARKLFCTREAAVRMQEIVDIIGTETEKRRASLILYNNSESPLTSEEVLQQFQKLSDYPVPPEWKIPIEVVDVDIPDIMKQLPPIAEKVLENLTLINQSVFLYGWAKRLTTVSSNRVVAKEIEATIENNRVDEETRGPHIWLTRASRSLVGKEKQSAMRSQGVKAQQDSKTNGHAN